MLSQARSWRFIRGVRTQGAEEPNLTFTRSIFELCTRAVSCVIRSVVFEFSPQRDPKRNRRFPSEARSAEKKKRQACLSSYCVTILRRPQSAVCGYPTESSDYAWGPGGAKNRLENNRSNIERVKVNFGSSAPCGSYCYEDVLTGAIFKRAPEARASWGVWGHAPPGNFEI